MKINQFWLNNLCISGLVVAGLARVTGAAPQATAPQATTRQAAAVAPSDITGVFIDVAHIHHDTASQGDTWDLAWGDDGIIPP